MNPRQVRGEELQDCLGLLASQPPWRSLRAELSSRRGARAALPRAPLRALCGRDHVAVGHAEARRILVCRLEDLEGLCAQGLGFASRLEDGAAGHYERVILVFRV